MSNDANEPKDFFEIIRLDYERTNEFVQSVLDTIGRIRGWAITVTIAVVGVAFEREIWELTLLAIVVVALFAFLDVYHSWLYGAAMRHAGELETAIASYHRYLAQREDDQEAVWDFEGDVKGHTFGLLRALRRPPGWRLIKGARPRPVILVIYLALLVTSLGSGVAIAKAESDAEGVGEVDDTLLRMPGVGPTPEPDTTAR